MTMSGSSLSSRATLTLSARTLVQRRAPMTPSASRRRSLDMSTTPAACDAIAVPCTPIATPTSEAASAGPSLTPSPTMPMGAVARDGGELLLRLHARDALGDTHELAHRARRLGRVAREHHRCHAELPERRDGLGALGAHTVSQAANGSELAVEQHPEHAAAPLLPPAHRCRVEVERAAAAGVATRAGCTAVVPAARRRRRRRRWRRRWLRAAPCVRTVLCVAAGAVLAPPARAAT